MPMQLQPNNVNTNVRRNMQDYPNRLEWAVILIMFLAIEYGLFYLGIHSRL